AKDERSIKKRLESILTDLTPGNSGLAYYDGDEPMSDEDKELLRISLENTIRLAKQMAKQKFTPKKYRK
ncbi:transcriptional regulator, partial|nr:transcriptional regulator [Dendrosporobacter quercicolus DSM 1736]